MMEQSKQSNIEIIDLKSKIRDIPDFPKKGIVFKDITTLLNDSEALSYSLDALAVPYKNESIHHVASIESRGFIFGVPIADRLKAGFVPIRKPGKLPYKTIEVNYELEYGTDKIAIHTDAIKPGDSIILIDDLLATGGTMKAAIELVEKLEGNIIGISVLIELSFLKGRDLLGDYPIHSVLKY
jgi:adenine phosphoribosyltransferase